MKYKKKKGIQFVFLFHISEQGCIMDYKYLTGLKFHCKIHLSFMSQGEIKNKHV